MPVNNLNNRPSPNVANTGNTTEAAETTNQPTTATPAETGSATALTNDGFDPKTNALNIGADKPDHNLSPEGQKKAKAAIDKFNTRLETIMNRGHKNRGLALAEAAAGGKKPYAPGDKFEAKDVEAMKNATKDLVMDMPIGALAPGAQNKIEGALKGTDLSLNDVKNKSLNELKTELGDRAKKIGKEVADNLKSNKPSVYYGIGVAGAAAIGAYGYAKGSKGLEQLGIKPEFKKGFFNDKVVANAKGTWDAEMKNPNLALGLNAKLKTDRGRLAFGAKANVGGKKLNDIRFKGASGNMSYTHALSKNNKLAGSVNANFDAEGKITSGGSSLKYSSDAVKLGLSAKHGENFDPLGYKLKGDFKLSPATTLGTNIDFDRKFAFDKGSANLATRFDKNSTLNVDANFDRSGFRDISAKYRYNSDNLNLSAGVKHDFMTDRTSASLSAGYQIRDNFSVGVIGSTDGDSNHRVGLGVSLSF